MTVGLAEQVFPVLPAHVPPVQVCDVADGQVAVRVTLSPDTNEVDGLALRVQTGFDAGAVTVTVALASKLSPPALIPIT